MKIWVTGAGGCLGSCVAKVVTARGHELFATTHWACPIESLHYVTRVSEVAPDAIINCAGRLPGADSLDMVLTNAVGPHILATLARKGVRIVHMSTDCVFAGRRQARHSSQDFPDPADLYGRTKLTGEVEAKGILNVRGSFVSKGAGFLKWLLNAEGEVEAWDSAEWTGTTVDVMGDKLVELAEGELEGVVHVASDQVTTKGWMVDMFAEMLKLPVTVHHKSFPYVFRALEPDVVLPDAEETLKAYAEELAKCKA